MTASIVQWHELPARLRSAIEEQAGPLTGTEPGGEAWRSADAGAVATFADANVRMWDEALQRTPGWPIDFRTGIARAWADHRGELARTTPL